MRDLDKAVFARVDVEIDVAGLAEVVLLGEPRIGDDLAVAASRHLHRIQDVRRTPRARNGDQEIARASMKIELLGEDILVAEIVAEAGERGRVVEGQRPQTAVLGEVDREMAGDAGTPAVADKYDGAAAVVSLMGGFADPFATLVERQLFRRAIGHLGATQGIRQGCEILVQLLAHVFSLLPSTYLRRPVMPLMSDAFSIERRWPTISTLSAPTTLPMKPMRLIGPPAATSGAVTARKASPAPTVSITFLANAEMVCTMPPLSNVTQPCLPCVMMIFEQSMQSSASRWAM